MIARINHEHAEREALEQERQVLLKTKQGLIADNKKRRDDLANLDKDLEKFIDVSRILASGTPFGITLRINAVFAGGETHPKDFRKGVLGHPQFLYSIFGRSIA